VLYWQGAGNTPPHCNFLHTTFALWHGQLQHLPPPCPSLTH
jgi:hypothetical protein